MSEPHGATAVRHRAADRIYHWVMAASIFVLLGTAFLPVLGLRFEWVPIHWISGVVLILAVLFHIYRVFAIKGTAEMTPRADDFREVVRDIRGAGHAGLAPAKYDAFQKAYHLATMLTVLTLIATGLPMLAKIDTALWRRNPAILSDQTWGAIYVVHGAAAFVVLFLVILHIYFALLPEHRGYLASILAGQGPAKARKGDA